MKEEIYFGEMESIVPKYFVSRDTWSIYFEGKYHYFHDLGIARAFGKTCGLTGKHIYSEVLGRYVHEEKEKDSDG